MGCRTLSFWDVLSAHLLPLQALEQSVEALKAMLTDLRLSVAAKDAELVIIKAEGESFRRQLIPRAQNTLSADTEVTLPCFMQPHQTWHETAHISSLYRGCAWQ